MCQIALLFIYNVSWQKNGICGIKLRECFFPTADILGNNYVCCSNQWGPKKLIMEDLFSRFVPQDVSPLSPCPSTEIEVEHVGLFLCMHIVFEKEKEESPQRC